MFDLMIPEFFNAAVYFIDRHVAEGRGKKIAIECGGERISYRELFEGVNRFGNGLRELGIRKGDRVLVVLPDIPEFGMAFFGAIKIGAIPVPVNPALKPEEHRYFREDSGARIAIDEGALRKSPFAKASPRLTAEPARRDDPAFWLYSSGSTGRPKACIHRQRDMLVCSEHYAKPILGMHEHDRCFSTSKLFFAYGLGNALYYPLAVGATSILLPDRPEPEKIFNVIERHRPTIFFSVPSTYVRMLAHPASSVPDLLSGVRLCISAGEPLPISLFKLFKERFGFEILENMGSTEALQAFIASRPGSVRPGSTGELVPGYDVRILDEAGKPAKPGEAGSLWVKNDAVAAGYWNQPEKTAATFKDGWLRTGDRFSRDADGYFWYAGREDDMFKSHGAWVSPVEVEHCLMEHPEVLEAAVVGKKNADGLLRPAAYVVPRSDVRLAENFTKELDEFCAGRLPKHKRPTQIEILSELPKTATGKIQRFKLRNG